MLKPWMKWLPLAIVEMIARKHCERVVSNGVLYSQPFTGVLIRLRAWRVDAPGPRKAEAGRQA